MPPVGFGPTISAGERPEESYRLCCVVVCDLETSRIGAPYIYDISNLRVNGQARGLVWAESGNEPRFAGRPNGTIVIPRGT